MHHSLVNPAKAETCQPAILLTSHASQAVGGNVRVVVVRACTPTPTTPKSRVSRPLHGHGRPSTGAPAAVLSTGDQQVLPEGLAELLGAPGAATCWHRCCPVLHSPGQVSGPAGCAPRRSTVSGVAALEGLAQVNMGPATHCNSAASCSVSLLRRHDVDSVTPPEEQDAGCRHKGPHASCRTCLALCTSLSSSG